MIPPARAAMNAHFASRNLSIPMARGGRKQKCITSRADVSPTAAQMPRAVGLAYASVSYRKLEELKDQKDSRSTAMSHIYIHWQRVHG